MDDIRSVWSIIGKDLSSLDGLPLQQRMSAACIVSAQDTDGSCSSCNCRFNNIQVLDQIIESKIANVPTGVTFIRWGKSTCPQTEGTEMLYAGRAGGTSHDIQGGGADKLCLPNDPDYLHGTSNISSTLPALPQIYGTEYEFFGPSPLDNLFNHNVPCARCYVPTRTAMIMIPAKTQCPSGWTREYYGYLTSERENHHRSSYDCVDVNSEGIGSADNEHVALLYYVVSTCIGLDCPPYENDRAISCVVCTK